jgi:hypothetical protein
VLLLGPEKSWSFVISFAGHCHDQDFDAPQNSRSMVMAADDFASRWTRQRSLLQKLGLLPSARRGQARSCARQAFSVIVLMVLTVVIAWRSRGGAIRPADTLLKGSSEDVSTNGMTSVLSAPKTKSSHLKGSGVKTSGANEELSSSEKKSDLSESTDTLEDLPSLAGGLTTKTSSHPDENVDVDDISLSSSKKTNDLSNSTNTSEDLPNLAEGSVVKASVHPGANVELGNILLSSKEKKSSISGSTDELEDPPSLPEGSTVKASIHPGTNVNVGEISLAGEKSHVSEPATCEPMPPSNTSVFKSIWVPSYPGSGSAMLRDLVVAITGLQASDLYMSSKFPEKCFGGKAVTCETHWPVLFEPDSPDLYKSKAHSSAVILFQNPTEALPSYVNWQHERYKKGENKRSQAPEHTWRQWRDDKFDEAIELWKDVLLRWHEELSYNIALHLPYEQLTNESTGPALLHELATLFRDIGSPVAKDEDLDCIWRRVVVERGDEKSKTRGYTPGYRPGQKARMVGVLNELMETLANQTELVDVLTSYKEDIRKNLRVEW